MLGYYPRPEFGWLIKASGQVLAQPGRHSQEQIEVATKVATILAQENLPDVIKREVDRIRAGGALPRHDLPRRSYIADTYSSKVKDDNNANSVTSLTAAHATSTTRDQTEITDVKTLYLAFVQQILEFTKSDGVKNVSSLIALMTDEYKQQFAESEDDFIDRFQFYGWGYTRECQVERFEHDGPNKVTVVRENLINGWPHVEFKRVGKGWKISDIKNN
ncbi:hypothetical protein ORJ04_18985 [Rheinheimera baltica]|uniref:Lipoprotein n=1 Tax=Rheinheimera baltica TaxID=67576 RepID=A0ABT9I3S9_9GAMM|nr:hypothetical protein [Rheinheimera baltica]MDP5138039.1 hypothetical protein [Rheinheimera baltica]